MRFEWDENKNQQNRQKHGISFEEAKEIFSGIVFSSLDQKFDYDEIREVSIGTRSVERRKKSNKIWYYR
jgi:uncharacterized DUF497 family protein